MAAGDILFYSNNDLGADLIKWRTHGPYSHCCTEVDSGHVVEANWPVVKYDIRGTPAAVYTPKLDAHKLVSALAWLHTKIGDTYDFIDIAANVFGFLLPQSRVFGRTPTAFVCSELVAYFLLKAGYIFPQTFSLDERSLSLVTPNDIARLVGLLPT